MTLIGILDINDTKHTWLNYSCVNFGLFRECWLSKNYVVKGGAYLITFYIHLHKNRTRGNCNLLSNS